MTVAMTVAMIKKQEKVHNDRPTNAIWLTEDRRALILKLAEEGMSVLEIGVVFGLPQNTMYQKLLRLNLLRFVKKSPRSKVEWGRYKQSIMKRLTEGENVTQIGVTFNLDRVAMQTILSRMGISANEQRKIGQAKAQLKGATGL